MEKILVACFSATGATKTVAQSLAEAEGADFFEIVPEVPYTAADLDWRDRHSRSTVEMEDLSARPEIADKVENMEQYDTVFIGFPIWWEREPSIIDTFLESYDFSGKVIIPFCTSGGSPIGFIGDRMRQIAKGSPKVVNGQRMGGSLSREDLRLWADGLEID